MESKVKGIVAKTPVADHRTKEGYFVDVAAGVATVSSSATTRPFGVILEGENTDGVDSIAISGGNAGPVKVKASGTISEGAYVQLYTDGSVVTDATSGARVLVGIALESAVSGDLFDCQLITPVYIAS
jgi:hypothetical protein